MARSQQEIELEGEAQQFKHSDEDFGDDEVEQIEPEDPVYDSEEAH